MSSLRTLVATLTILGAAANVYPCSNISAGKNATTDGSVITSHTCDGRYDSRVVIVPAQDWKPGTMAPVMENIVNGDEKALVKLGEIPQVPHTYKYFSIAYPFANEHQLLIGETTLGGAEETKNSDKAIMTIEQLEVFALQRCKTAREAVQLMGDLAVKYGYRESCYLGECLTVSDPNEVWVLEMFGTGPLWTPESGKPGAVWCAQRVPDDHITATVNYSRISTINPKDTKNFMVSKNYIDTAVELGLYDPAKNGEFRWNLAYGNVAKMESPRLWRIFNVLAPSYKLTYQTTAYYPFSVKPDKKINAQDVTTLLQDTYKGAGLPYDMLEQQQFFFKNAKGEFERSVVATPHMPRPQRAAAKVQYYRPVSVYYNSYWFVSQARGWMPNEVGGLLWFGLENPENSLAVPLYVGVDAVPENWKTLDQTKFSMVESRKYAWWAFSLVDETVNMMYGKLKPMLAAERDPIQKKLFDGQAAFEQKAIELLKKDKKAGVKALTDYTGSAMTDAANTYWALYEKLLYKVHEANN